MPGPILTPGKYTLHSASNRYLALPPNFVIVFGSNLAARHGKGAAKDALLYFGASRRIAEGISGQSYAIPTKDANLNVLPIARIDAYVRNFIQFARAHPELTFIVTRVGCGLAGYHDAEMVSPFLLVPSNCYLPDTWGQFLPDGSHFVRAHAQSQWLA